MKITITYPPLKKGNRIPLLSQNRQFQWFNDPTYIYPVVPASAATILKNNNHQVFWLDGIAENLTQEKYFNKLKQQKPDLIIIETKTPVIKLHWQIINKIKKILPKTKVALVGDHVTALPKESFDNSQIDYILTGGYYDLLSLNLVNHLENKAKLAPGIYCRQGKKLKNTGKFQSPKNLDQLPHIDRNLTQWQLYAYKNGNFVHTPGTYIMAGRDCWWRKNGGCKFCAWTILYPKFSQRSVEDVIKEIEMLVKKYKVKEIMDDTGTFPGGQWLRDFCKTIIKKGLHKKVTISCNLRFGNLSKKDYQLLAKANFRFLLYGLESANQKTLDKLNKGTKIDEIKSELQLIKELNKKQKSKLQPHVTCMIGYPWESYQQAHNTISFCNNLSKKGLISSLQATIITPYPGTKLFKELDKNKLLKTYDWNEYDMSKSVIKTPLTDKQIKNLIRLTYSSAITPSFIWQIIKSIKSPKDIVTLVNQTKKYISKFLDFK